MGNQYSKRGEGSTSKWSSSNSSKFVPDLSFYEAACREDPGVESFDSILHRRTCQVIKTLANDANERSLSLDSVREVTEYLLDMNKEVVKVILESEGEIEKNEKLLDLVQEYFRNNILTLEFCNALDKCIMKARDQQLILELALQKFVKEKRTTQCYKKTLRRLKDFMDAGDPFTELFFYMFHTIYNQQMSLLEKLKVKNKKLHRKWKRSKSLRKVSNVIFAAATAAVLICSVVAAAITAPPLVSAVAAAAVPLGSMGKWINSQLMKYEKELKREWDNICEMQNGTFITIADLESIRVLVESFQIAINSLAENANLALSKEQNEVDPVMDVIKKKLKGFNNTIDNLAEHADTFRRSIMDARTRIIKHIGNG